MKTQLVTKETILVDVKTGKRISITYDPNEKHSFMGFGKPKTIDESGEEARQSAEALVRALESDDPFHLI